MSRVNGFPVRAEGVREKQRNWWCPRYNDCLSHAARRYWPGFSCVGCEYEAVESLEVDPLFNLLCLLAAILHPQKYRTFAKLEGMLTEKTWESY